jgi:hypothetical protein
MITGYSARRARLVVLAATLLALAGCATMQRGEAASTEQLLTAAGFQMRPANTPERLADLNAMPPGKLLVSSRAGNVIYTYADPERCRCLYVGGPKEYSALQRLRVEKEIAADEPQSGLDWPGLGISWE